MIAAIFSALHLLALGIGLGSVWTRGRALRARTWDADAIRRVLAADNFWGIAALLWIGTGLVRVLAGLDKGTDFYISNGWFRVKMGGVALVLVLEAWPMTTFIRWRRARGRGAMPDTTRTATLARISTAQAILVVLIVFVAAMMTRGLWMLP